MTPILTTIFTSPVLTEEEFLQGSIFTQLQIQVIQNRLSQYAIEKVYMKYDPTKPIEYAQQEAELTGQINLLQQLLDESVSSNIALNDPDRAPAL